MKTKVQQLLEEAYEAVSGSETTSTKDKAFSVLKRATAVINEFAKTLDPEVDIEAINIIGPVQSAIVKALNKDVLDPLPHKSDNIRDTMAPHYKKNHYEDLRREVSHLGRFPETDT